jgi:hypothetical protein
VTRHTVEEFSNLGKFLPLVWNDPSVVAARNSLLNPLRLNNMPSLPSLPFFNNNN